MGFQGQKGTLNIHLSCTLPLVDVYFLNCGVSVYWVTKGGYCASRFSDSLV